MAVSAQPSQVAPEDLLGRVQELSERVEALEDPRARTLAQDLVSAVIAMYGDGLERMLAAVRESREAGATLLDQFASDGAVASLLLIHDLYPVGLRERVIEALDTVRPYMESHGGNVELISLDEGVARIALQGSCHGCSASRATLELAIKQALDEHAPDLAGLEVEGVVEAALPPSGTALPMASAPPPASSPLTVGLPLVQVGGEREDARWVAVAESLRPAAGDLRTVTIAGEAVVLASVQGTLLAYRDTCAACGERLRDATLEGPLLRCAHCAAAFDLPRAGRAIPHDRAPAGGTRSRGTPRDRAQTGQPLQLAPVPLLEDGGLRVAV